MSYSKQPPRLIEHAIPVDDDVPHSRTVHCACKPHQTEVTKTDGSKVALFRHKQIKPGRREWMVVADAHAPNSLVNWERHVSVDAGHEDSHACPCVPKRYWIRVHGRYIQVFFHDFELEERCGQE